MDTNPRVINYNPSLGLFSLVLRVDSIFLSKNNTFREGTRNREELSGIGFAVSVFLEAWFQCETVK